MSFVDACLSWNNVSALKLIFFILFVVGLNYYIFHINGGGSNVNTTTDHKSSGPFDTCLITCKNQICKNITSNSRESNYSLGITSNAHVDDCIFTGWEFSHVILHMFLGYYFNIYISVSLSVLFEIYEHYVYNCASWLDLFWNTFGLLIGIYIRYRQQQQYERTKQ